MILAALLLQAAVPARAPAGLAVKPPATAPAKPGPADAASPDAAAPPAASVPPKLRPLDAATAVDTFKQLCWAHFREPDDFHAALPSAPIPLAEVPRAHPGATETYRAEEGVLTYIASDDPPAGAPSRQCTLRTKLAGAADQLTLAARVATALGLGNGSTQTGRGAARTIWDVRQPDGRIVRLIAITANAAGGQSDLRLQALLLGVR